MSGKSGNHGAQEPVSYSRTMGRWDPEPTSLQRWIVSHRTGFRVTAFLLLALAICGLVYDLVTGGLPAVVPSSPGTTVHNGVLPVHRIGQDDYMPSRYGLRRRLLCMRSCGCLWDSV